MRSFKNTYYDIKRHHDHSLGFLDSSLSFIDISNVQKRINIRGENTYDKYLSDWEHSYINSIKVNKRKTDFISGRLAGKRAVRRHLIKGIEQAAEENNILFSNIEIKRTVTGRPVVFIKDGLSRNGRSDLLISISHTQGVAASLVCSKKDCKGIGIDIEKIEEKDGSLLDIAFTKEEIEKLLLFIAKGNGRGSELFEENIARYWSIKEAVMKSMGVGVNIDLKDIVVKECEGYSATVELLNEAKKRYELLEGKELKVESARIKNFMIAISSMY